MARQHLSSHRDSQVRPRKQTIRAGLGLAIIKAQLLFVFIRQVNNSDLNLLHGHTNMVQFYDREVIPRWRSWRLTAYLFTQRCNTTVGCSISQSARQLNVYSTSYSLSNLGRRIVFHLSSSLRVGSIREISLYHRLLPTSPSQLE